MLLQPSASSVVGQQLPRIEHAPAAATSAGQEAVELAASAGLFLDPWQAHVLDVACREKPNGDWAAFEVGLIVARQQGKGSLLEARELAGLFLFGERLILHSAHQVKTSNEAFLRLEALIKSTPDLHNRVARYVHKNGEEGIELKSGARIKFVARSGNSGRGFSADTIILDEAYNTPEQALGALMPTMAARPNPQVWYTSSAVDRTVQAHQNGIVLSRLRERALKGDDPSLAFMEWSAAPDRDADDEIGWAEANPALGYRLSFDHIARERRSMDSDSFAVERLSQGRWFSDDDSESAIPATEWAQLADPMSQIQGRPAFAVEVAPDRSRACISVAGRRIDGKLHVETVEELPGVFWVPRRMSELQHQWKPVATVLDAGGPGAALIPELKALNVTLTTIGTREFAQACGAFYDAVLSREMRHLGASSNPDDRADPGLTDAVKASTWRTIGESRGWSRRGSMALVAATLAAHGVRSSEAGAVTGATQYKGSNTVYGFN